MWNELVTMSYSNKYNEIELYQQNLQDLDVSLKIMISEKLSSAKPRKSKNHINSN
jgi:hypothetical protein